MGQIGELNTQELQAALKLPTRLRGCSEREARCYLSRKYTRTATQPQVQALQGETWGRSSSQPQSLAYWGILCLFWLPETPTSLCRRIPDAEDAPAHSGYPPPLLTLIFSCRTSTQSLFGFLSDAMGLGKPCSPRQGGASLKSPCCSLGRGWEENIPPGAQGRGHESSSPCSPRVIQLESFFPPSSCKLQGGGVEITENSLIRTEPPVE